MVQWYLVDNGQQVGPLDTAAARAHAATIPAGHCWRDGFAAWTPIAACAELGPDAPPSAPPPFAGGQRADVVDFTIYGDSVQFVEVQLDPGESVFSEAGAMMYKDAVVSMETIFGDGKSSGGGLMDQLLGAGRRLVTGETLFTTVFSNTGDRGKAKVAFAAPYPGTIVPLSLSDYGGRLICQKDSFLAAARGVSIGVHLQRKVMTALFGGEGFIMQKLEGDGLVFVHAGGTIVERQLHPGEILHVDAGCVVAHTDTVHFDIQPVGSVKSMLFSGEGVFMATLAGPGHVWVQSLPFSRLLGRMQAAMVGLAVAL